MRRIEAIEDRMSGLVTYELSDGQRFRVEERVVRDLGIAAIMRNLGLEAHLPTERMAVFQGGQKIGTMKPDFDPLAIRSTNFFYDPRPGDFRLTDDGWIAAENLGPGDFEAIPGFVWERRNAAD